MARGPGPGFSVPARLVFGAALTGAVVASCTALTGASDLEICEGVECVGGLLDSDGSTTTSTPSTADGSTSFVDGTATIKDGSPSFFDTSTDAFFDPDADKDPPTDAATPCSNCDGGTCQAVGGGCDSPSACCSNLKCTTRGKCAQNCVATSGFCFAAQCCLGSKCSLALECTSCALNGVSCTNPGQCCSNKCTNNACEGSVSGGGGFGM